MSRAESERATSCGYLIRRGELLLERRPSDALVSPGCWDTPGGHHEPGETPEAALVRELSEELGIRAERYRLAAVLAEVDRRSGRSYRHYHFWIESWSGTVRSREGRTLRWFPLSTGLPLESLHPLVLEALRRMAARGWIGY